MAAAKEKTLTNIGIRSEPRYEPDPAAQPDPENHWEQVTPTPEVPTAAAQDDEAMRAAEVATTPRPLRGTVAMSTGVMFKLRPVPPLLIRRAQAEVTRPRAPIWRNAANDREEPNESDPDYLRAMQAYEEATADAAINAMIVTGTAIGFVPEGFPPVDDDEWIDNAIESGLWGEGRPVFKTPRGRYLAWVKYAAIGTMEDLAELGAAVGRLTGISEEDMASAIATFRRRSEGGADRGADLPEVDPDGDQLPAANGGDGARD